MDYQTFKYEGMTIEQQLAYHALRYGLIPTNYVTIQDIDQITQNEEGLYIATTKNGTPPITCKSAINIDGQIVLITMNNEMIADINCNYELAQLISASETGIAFSAYSQGKDLVFDVRHELPSDPQRLSDTVKQQADQCSPYRVGKQYGQPVYDVEYVGYNYLKEGIGRLVETPTQIIIDGAGHSSVEKKYQMLTAPGTFDTHTAIDQILDDIKTELGKEATQKDIAQEFNKRLADMLEKDPEGVKRLLAEVCYQKGLTPTFVDSFDPNKTQLRIREDITTISISGGSLRSPNGNEMTPNELVQVGLQDVYAAAMSSESLILAIGTSSTVNGQTGPMLFSSIDFSKELREVQEQHLTERLTELASWSEKWAYDALEMQSIHPDNWTHEHSQSAESHDFEDRSPS